MVTWAPRTPNDVLSPRLPTLRVTPGATRMRLHMRRYPTNHSFLVAPEDVFTMCCGMGGASSTSPGGWRVEHAWTAAVRGATGFLAPAMRCDLQDRLGRHQLATTNWSSERTQNQ